MQKGEYILFVYIPLPKEVVSSIAHVQKRLNYKHPAGPPHVTVYLCAYTKLAYKQLLKQLDAQTFKKFSISLGKLKKQPSRTIGEFYFMPIAGAGLKNFHKQILAQANPLRGNRQRQKELERVKQKKYTKGELKYLDKYGYVHVLDKFQPHVTVIDTPHLDTFAKDWLKRQTAHVAGTHAVGEFVVSLLHRTTTYTQVAEKVYTLKK